MKIFQNKQTRQEYFNTQVARSNSKFQFCKVSVTDVLKYRTIIRRDMAHRSIESDAGPILCLGTRNGREVDLFRTIFFKSSLLRCILKALERETHSFVPLIPQAEAFGRSDLSNISRVSAIGVEINPRARRSDVWTGSFDEMPCDWTNKFNITYSNSFDQSQDPNKTAKEWERVTRPGGYLVFCFAEAAEPTESDPVGNLNLRDVLGLFCGGLIYYQERGSSNGYSEVIVRVPDPKV